MNSRPEWSIENGVLVPCDYIASPNFNQRPNNEVSLLVIHNISLPPGQFGTGCITDFFCNQLDTKIHPFFSEIEGVRVSSHLVIERTGRVIQFVPFDKRAWHAGESSFDGRNNCNDFSIGIELEGTDDTPFTDQQYRALIDITYRLMLAYPLITPNRITGHQHIAPERKTDPGPLFDWQLFLSSIAKSSN